MSIHMLAYPGNSGDEDQILGDPIYGHVDADAFSTQNNLLVARSQVVDLQDKFKCESRPHACEICQRRFKRKQHLKAHMNVHAKEQPTIWCSICGEGFLQNQAFESHACMPYKEEGESYDDEHSNDATNTSHDTHDTTQEAKKENHYPQEFVDVSVLASAELDQGPHLPENELPAPQRVFVCKYCTKPFKRKDHYKIHLNIHTGVKSFFCPDCGKGFYRKDHLQKHVLVHLKMRPAPKKEIPALYPIKMLPKKKEVKPEITIHAPSNTKLRVPLQIKVPYQMVMSLDNGEQRAITIDPQDTTT